MQRGGHVLVIGAAGVDIKGIPRRALAPHTSNPGIVQQSFGGVGRNIAENLVRLGVPVVLLTVLGDDLAGESIRAHAQTCGLDVSHAKRGGRTGSYLAIDDAEGDLAVAVSDFEIMQLLDAEYLTSQRDLFQSARMVVLDLNLDPAALACALDLAGHVPVFVDPTSNAKAPKLRPHLHRIWGMAPNAAEAAILSDMVISTPAQALRAAAYFVQMGMTLAVITLGVDGAAFACADGSNAHLAGLPVQVVEANGAGDALSAGLVFGMLQGLPPAEAVYLGMAAAVLTLQSPATVADTLSADLLRATR